MCNYHLFYANSSLEVVSSSIWSVHAVQRGLFCDSVSSVPGEDSQHFTAINSRMQCVHAGLFTVATDQASVPGFGGHQEGGLFNSVPAREEIVEF